MERADATFGRALREFYEACVRFNAPAVPTAGKLFTSPDDPLIVESGRAATTATHNWRKRAEDTRGLSAAFEGGRYAEVRVSRPSVVRGKQGAVARIPELWRTL